jgi:hypothetical protein
LLKNKIKNNFFKKIKKYEKIRKKHEKTRKNTKKHEKTGKNRCFS